MKSSVLGRNTLKVEVLDISQHGVWLHVKGKEFFLSHEDYPWFKEAKVSDVYNLKFMHGSHLYWPDLDIDLELRSLEDPKNYPLIYK